METRSYTLTRTYTVFSPNKLNYGVAGAGHAAQLRDFLPSADEALGSIPSTALKKYGGAHLALSKKMQESRKFKVSPQNLSSGPAWNTVSQKMKMGVPS